MENWQNELRKNLHLIKKMEICENLIFYLNNFISILETHPLLYRIYSKSVGVWEGYDLRNHTLMVLMEYLKHFSLRNLPEQIEKEPFLLILALHDVGKPIAVEKGDRNLQHYYTCKLIEQLNEDLPYNLENLISLIDGDPIGRYFCGQSLEKTLREIKDMAKRSDLSLEHFFSLLVIYYQVDAGSYTKDAGGLLSLDHLFTNNFSFNLVEKRLDFSKKYDLLFQKLKEALF